MTQKKTKPKKQKTQKFTDGLYTWDDSYPKTFFLPYPTKDAQFIPDADLKYRGFINAAEEDTQNKNKRS